MTLVDISIRFRGVKTVFFQEISGHFTFSFGATEIAYFLLEVKPSQTVNHGDQIRYFEPNQAVSKP